MEKFIVVYKHFGEEYSLQIPAISFDDARARLKSLSEGEVLGQVVIEFGVDGPLNPLISTTKHRKPTVQ